MNRTEHTEYGRDIEKQEEHFHMGADGKRYTHIHTHTGEACGHTHRHIHSAEEKKAVLNRLSKALGHMEAVKRMVENDADCSEVLIQLAAVRSAINSTGKVILKNHISHCIVEALEANDEKALQDLNEAIDKFIK